MFSRLIKMKILFILLQRPSLLRTGRHTSCKSNKVHKTIVVAFFPETNSLAYYGQGPML
jgi:hypothetical protein